MGDEERERKGKDSGTRVLLPNGETGRRSVVEKTQYVVCGLIDSISSKKERTHTRGSPPVRLIDGGTAKESHAQVPTYCGSLNRGKGTEKKFRKSVDWYPPEAVGACIKFIRTGR